MLSKPMNNPKFFVKDIDKDRTLVINKKTGKETIVVKDQKYKEMAANGDFLQPVGKDERKFFDRNPQYKKNEKGEIVNVELENYRKQESEAVEFERKEVELFKKLERETHKKFY